MNRINQLRWKSVVQARGCCDPFPFLGLSASVLWGKSGKTVLWKNIYLLLLSPLIQCDPSKIMINTMIQNCSRPFVRRVEWCCLGGHAFSVIKDLGFFCLIPKEKILFLLSLSHHPEKHRSLRMNISIYNSIQIFYG